jgi:CDP-glycerol glycerophosphotransferase
VENLDQIQAEYEEKYNIFYKKYCGWEDGRASQRVVDAVFGREQESAE